MSDERDILLKYARDTWRSFTAMTSDIGLPADHLCRSVNGQWMTARYTSPTNIGTYIWSTVAAEDLGIVTNQEAIQRISQTLMTLNRLEREHGFFFNWYNPATGERINTWPVDGNSVRQYLSSVDNGWLATALILLRNSRTTFADSADSILSHMNFGFFYDAYNVDDPIAHPGQLWGGYDTTTKTFDNFHYDLLNTESRIASYVGIAMGDIPAEHYYRIYRTLPAEWDWQKQIPDGRTHTYFGMEVFEGHYVYRDKRIVPSWGGSMFEALMVPLFVPESIWAPTSWGVNHPLYIECQIEHGLKDMSSKYWGFSPANKPEGGYRVYGVDIIGTNPDGYPSNNDNTLVDRNNPLLCSSLYANGVVTPHASFLALPFFPYEALENLRLIVQDFEAYCQYGFLDSINIQSGRVSDCVLALDQGMIMAAITNVVHQNSLQYYFSNGMVEKAIRPLIAPEKFTAGRFSTQ